MPMTPRGTLFRPIRRPFGRFFIPRTSPMGSSSAATCLSPSAIPSMRDSLSISRSTSPSFIFRSLALRISFSLARRISSFPESKRPAARSSTAFFFPVSSVRRRGSAFFARLPISSRRSWEEAYIRSSVTRNRTGMSSLETGTSSTIWKAKAAPMVVWRL